MSSSAWLVRWASPEESEHFYPIWVELFFLMRILIHLVTHVYSLKTFSRSFHTCLSLALVVHCARAVLLRESAQRIRWRPTFRLSNSGIPHRYPMCPSLVVWPSFCNAEPLTVWIAVVAPEWVAAPSVLLLLLLCTLLVAGLSVSQIDGRLSYVACIMKSRLHDGCAIIVTVLLYFFTLMCRLR
jgi:hypothetical protein